MRCDFRKEKIKRKLMPHSLYSPIGKLKYNDKPKNILLQKKTEPGCSANLLTGNYLGKNTVHK